MPANKKKAAHRAKLETVTVEAAVIKMKLSLIRLRVEQAEKRTGLVDLLSPALKDIDEAVKCLGVISAQVTQLMER